MKVDRRIIAYLWGRSVLFNLPLENRVFLRYQRLAILIFLRRRRILSTYASRLEPTCLIDYTPCSALRAGVWEGRSSPLPCAPRVTVSSTMPETGRRRERCCWAYRRGMPKTVRKPPAEKNDRFSPKHTPRRAEEMAVISWTGADAERGATCFFI